jgi:hypothetical protein
MLFSSRAAAVLLGMEHRPPLNSQSIPSSKTSHSNPFISILGVMAGNVIAGVCLSGIHQKPAQESKKHGHSDSTCNHSNLAVFLCEIS